MKANRIAQERNDAIRTTSDSSLFEEFRAQLGVLAKLQRKPIKKFFVSLFGARNRTQQRLTGLELMRLQQMAGLTPPDDVNPDRLVWISYRRFRDLLAKAEVRRSEWEGGKSV